MCQVGILQARSASVASASHAGRAALNETRVSEPVLAGLQQVAVRELLPSNGSAMAIKTAVTSNEALAMANQAIVIQMCWWSLPPSSSSSPHHPASSSHPSSSLIIIITSLIVHHHHHHHHHHIPHRPASLQSSRTSVALALSTSLVCPPNQG